MFSLSHLELKPCSASAIGSKENKQAPNATCLLNPKQPFNCAVQPVKIRNCLLLVYLACLPLFFPHAFLNSSKWGWTLCFLFCSPPPPLSFCLWEMMWGWGKNMTAMQPKTCRCDSMWGPLESREKEGVLWIEYLIELRHDFTKKKKKKMCGRERQRAWGIKYLKWWRRLLVWREWERGVRCELQIVGAHVVEVAQVPGALLFHGSYSLSVKTAQPCRQLCSGGCGGARRGPLFSILILISISGLIFLLALCITIPPNFFGLCRVCSFYLQKYHKINLQQPWQYLHVQFFFFFCFYKVKPCSLICLLSLFFCPIFTPFPPTHTHA